MMDNASNFAIDVQEMYASGEVTQQKFNAILAKYGGTKREDGITLDFADGSSARWQAEQGAWELNPKGLNFPVPNGADKRTNLPRK